jgi:hypothetical protein
LVIHVNKLAYVLILLVCLSVLMYPFLAQNQTQTVSEGVERAHQLIFNLTQYIYVEGDCDNDPFHDAITNAATHGVWILLSRQTSRTYHMVSGLLPSPAWWSFAINRFADTGGRFTNEYVITFYYTTTTTTQVNIHVSDGANIFTVFFIPSRTYTAYNVYRWVLRVPYTCYETSDVTICAQPWSPVPRPWQAGQWQLVDIFMYGNTQVSVSPTYTFSITKINDYQIRFSYSIIFQSSADVGKKIDFYGLVYNYGGGAVSQVLLSASFPEFTISQVGDALVFVFDVYLVSG